MLLVHEPFAIIPRIRPGPDLVATCQVWSLTAAGDLASPKGSGRWSGMASKRWPKGQPVAGSPWGWGGRIGFSPGG